MSAETYRVRFTVPVEVIVTVTAADEDDAEAAAFDIARHHVMALGTGSTDVTVSGDLDGVAADSVEEVSR
jgi:hypothetical protein